LRRQPINSDARFKRENSICVHYGRAHLPEIIRRRFDRDFFNRVGNPARRLVARLAEPAKGEVIAPVAKVVPGFFGVHKRRDTLPAFFKAPFLLRFGVRAHGRWHTPLAFLGAAFLEKRK
jgi:hypothetical protein